MNFVQFRALYESSMGKTPPVFKAGSLEVDKEQTYVNQRKLELKPGETFTFEDEKRWRQEGGSQQKTQG